MLTIHTYEQKFKRNDGTYMFIVQFNPVPNERALKHFINRVIMIDGDEHKVLEAEQSITYPYSMVTLIAEKVHD